MNTKSLTIQGLPRRTFWYPYNVHHLRMPATTAHYSRQEREGLPHEISTRIGFRLTRRFSAVTCPFRPHVRCHV